MRKKSGLVLVLGTVLLLSACGGSYSGTPGGSSSSSNGNSGGGFSTPQAFFAAEVEPNIGFCRTCHIAGGVADTPGTGAPNTQGNLYLLSGDSSQDYNNVYAAWQALGSGVTSNLLLLNPSNPAQAHAGGQPWPQGSQAYAAMQTLLTCWSNPSGCATLLAGSGGAPVAAQQPLLGDLTATGGRNWVGQLCNGQPDDTPIDWSQEPRALMSGANIDNPNYAVYFNDPWENCHTDTLFATQARQNALRAAKGQTQIYTAQPNPATCGAWRTRVQAGFNFVTQTAITGAVIPASVYADVWKQWGLSSRPADFDAQVVQRYGFSPSPFPNPYPLDGENPATTNGGSGQLPLGWAQGKDANGNYNGMLGINCFICHAGRIGSGNAVGTAGEVPTNPADAVAYGANPSGSFMGYPNNLQDFGLQINELLRTAALGGAQIPFFGTPYNVNSTRGTHAADADIVEAYMLRDVDTMNFAVEPTYYPRDALWLSMFGPNTGDQAPPPWWWAHNKARYLWFGGHSNDTARGDMFFGAATTVYNGDFGKSREGLFENVRLWQDSVEAPAYPYGFCTGAGGAPGPNDNPACINQPLAEQGAILFHSLDLWSASTVVNGQTVSNSAIPRPPGGNGSCAGCHGAYSPQFASQAGFLPDPRMIGENSYTVPLAIIGTDPAQATGWTPTVRAAVTTIWNSYPDAVSGYKLPEQKSALDEETDDYGALAEGLSGPALDTQISNAMGLLDIPGLSAAMQPLLSLLDVVPSTEPVAQFFGRVTGACAFETKTVGYTAPPLHGVWAAAPYFHNGSVPTVWGVLKPSDRPPIWERQLVPAGTTSGVDRGFDPSMAAYDTVNLGWKYTTPACGASANGIPLYDCAPADVMPQTPGSARAVAQGIYTILDGGLAWPTDLQVPAVGQEQVEVRKIYNTALYSKGNEGHQFTQVLTDAQRKAIIEYLKTL
jgi:endo-cleaving rubber dioxygenase